MLKRILKNGFVKKILIYFVGTLSSNLINVLLLPLYAYFVTASNLGDYDYILSIANMLVPILFLCIWESALKFGIKVLDDKDLVFSNIVLLQLVLSILGLIIFGIIHALKITQVSLIMVLLFILIQGWAQVWQYSARAYGENRLYVIAGIAGSIAVVLIDVLFIIKGELNWVGLSVSHIISQFIIWVILEWKLKLLSKMKIKKASLDWIKRILAFSVPLVVNNVALWFYSGGIRLVIKNSLGAAETGMYSFASKFSVIITLCGAVVSMAFIEEVYGYRDMDEYRRKTSRMIAIISKAYFSIVFLALPAIYLLYSVAFKNTEYYLSSDYVLALLLSVLFTALSNSYGSAFQITNPKYVAVTTVIGGAVAVLLSLCLVDYIGIYAILFASIVGPFIMMLLRAVYARKVTGVRVDWKVNILILTVTFLMAYILQLSRNIYIEIIALLSAFVGCVFFYRKEIRHIVKGDRP